MNAAMTFSKPRMVITSLVVIFTGLIIAGVIATRPEPAPDHQSASLRLVGLDSPIQNRLAERFTDLDQDLVADPPTDPGLQVDPDTLLFSYIANEAENPTLRTTWKDFVDFLAERTGKPVSYLALPSRDEQLRALKDGTLHVTGLNPGNVPLAVNDCGFIPLCTPGNEDGIIGYTMQLIVPADSPIQSIEDIRGKTLTLTQPGSNSGYKAPLVLLMQDFGLQVERDYYIRFSRGHDASILGVADGTFEVAAVAGDLLHRAIDRGVVKDDAVRVIYESERFCTATLGILHVLAPPLAESIRSAFLEFDWTGSGLATEFASLGADRFVPVNYKDHWALIRRIDDAVGFKHEIDPTGDQ